MQHWLLAALFVTAALVMAGCAVDPAAAPQSAATAPVVVASTPTATSTPTQAPTPAPTPKPTPTPTPKPAPSVQVSQFPMLPDSVRCGPYTLAVGKDDNVWFLALCGSDANVSVKLGRITPAGKITEFPFPKIGYTLETQWMLTVGPDGNLWSAGSLGAGGSEIVRISSSGKITEFPGPTPNDLPPGIFALGLLVAGPDGNL